MKTKTLLLFLFFYTLSWSQTTIFSENMGSPPSSSPFPLIASNTFQNSSPITFTGTADARSTSPSLGYSGASSNGNIFFTNSNGISFVISGIDTSNYNALTLSFGHLKTTNASSNELKVEVSSDGTNYTTLSYTRATGSGTSNWQLITPTGTIPTTSNLRIRFTQTINTVSTFFRVDDVLVKGTLCTTNANIGSVTTGSSTLCGVGGTSTYTTNNVVLGGGTGTWSSNNTAIATVNSAGIVTAVAPGSANIKYTITGGCGGTKSAQAGVVVTTLPTTPNITTITQPTCILATASVALSNLPATGTWTIIINPIVAGATGTTGSGTTTTIGGLTANASYTFTVSNGTCSSLPSANAVINSVPALATWNGSEWAGTASITTPPTLLQPVTFTGNYTSSGNLNGCSCTINPSVAVIINSGDTLSITNNVAVNTASGTSLTFENTASLVQQNDADSNSGDIIYKRNTQPMLRYDFTYWSSPILGQTLGTPVTGLSPLTLSDKYFSFDTAANNWKQEANTATMQVGKGYIVRAPQTHDTTSGPLVFNAVFKGKPNNGILFCPDAVQAGVACLIGNPYPSAINADTFLTANNLVIDGTIYFWTHNTLPFLNNYTNTDYASYNFTGGTSTSSIADSGGVSPNGKIAAGQSFFAVGKTGVVNGTVNFNNAMRVATDATGSNTQFFRKSNTKKTTSTSTPDKSRVWLNLSSTSGAFRQILVGYINGATNAIDLAYDGASFTNNPNDFYSINESNNLVIQGRAVPFDAADQVPLGYTSNLAGNFSIGIDQTDGVLANQDIFVEDKLLATTQNLKVSPYTFATAIGTFDNRFVLKFDNNNSSFGGKDLEKTNHGVLIFCKNKQIQIKSTLEKIDKVIVFDMAGKRIYEKSNVGTNELLIKNLISSEQTLIIKTSLTNGQTSSEKVIFE
jgi:hypothetical protein